MSGDHNRPPLHGSPPAVDTLPIQPAPAVVDEDMAVLLSEPFAGLYDQARTPADTSAVNGSAGAVRRRLQGRISATRDAEAGMVTVRLRRHAGLLLGPGVTARELYAASADAPLRPGEPLRARLIDIAAGQVLSPELLGSVDQLTARHREWLLVSGAAEADGQRVTDRDYLVTPAGCASPTWQASSDVRLFLRESPAVPVAGAEAAVPRLVRDAEAGWPDFAPGIQRRVLWQAHGQAALLYYAQAGAMVPNHVHGHDEECLMVQGELFLDDLLLQTGDYQLAPAGTGHRVTHTDTGVVIYAHGDADLQFV